MSDVFAMPINFAPGAETLETLVHSTDSFHVIIGLDPIGAFTEVTGLQVDNPVFTYEEMGRNRSPVQLPWDGARKGGEVTLSWGTIIRSRFWNWFQAQTPFFMERQPVFILHLSRRNIPLRVFVLWDAWPKSWHYSDLGTNQVTVEKVTLVYDRMFMLDTALLALMPELTNSISTNDVLDEVDNEYQVPPKSPEYTGTPIATADWVSVNHPGRVSKPAPWRPLDVKNDTEKAKKKETKAPPPYVPLDEEYSGLAGTWETEAVPEEYMSTAGIWPGLDGKKVYGAAKSAVAAAAAGGADGGGDSESGAGASGGGASGGSGDAASGDGKAVEEEDG